MREIELRTAAPEDAGELLDIYAYYILNTAVTSEFTVPTVEEFAERIRKVLLKYPFLVAIVEDRIVGYAYVREFHDRAAYAWSCESSIYVDRQYHKMGIGRKLYLTLEDILKKQNIVNIYASVSFPKEETEYLNMDSCIFHSRLGYRIAGEFHQCRYKFGEWYNMAWMEKAIAPHEKDQPEFIPFPLIREQTGL